MLSAVGLLLDCRRGRGQDGDKTGAALIVVGRAEREGPSTPIHPRTWYHSRGWIELTMAVGQRGMGMGMGTELGLGLGLG